MKILVIGVNYAPEISGIAPYTTGMAQGLSELGHDVRVITGIPHYPQWTNFTGFTGLRRTEDADGVHLTRVRHFIGSGGRGAGRILQELSFGVTATLTPWGRPDAVLTVSPPLISSALVVGKARLLRRPVAVWVQDLYSNGAKEINESGHASRALGLLESGVLRAASGVVVIHERFRRHLVDDLGVADERICVSRNWSHLREGNVSDPASMRERYFPNARIVALHTGNMGAKQFLDNVVEAARLAPTIPGAEQLVFGLVGNGAQREHLEQLGRDVPNLVFVPSLDDADYAGVLQCADVLLVNEKPGLRESAVPSKLTSYFMQRKPVVAATESDSATADEVRASGAGVVIEPGQPEKLVATVLEVLSDPDQARRLGQSAREFAEEHLLPAAAVHRVATWLAKLAVA